MRRGNNNIGFYTSSVITIIQASEFGHALVGPYLLIILSIMWWGEGYCMSCYNNHTQHWQLIINLSISGKLEIWKKNIVTGNLISNKPYLISGKLGIIASK